MRIESDHRYGSGDIKSLTKIYIYLIATEGALYDAILALQIVRRGFASIFGI